MHDTEILNVIEQVVTRRASGEALDDQAVLDMYPGLRPGLDAALNNAGRVRRAARDARYAGPATTDIVALSASELDAPIESMPPPLVHGYHMLGEVGGGAQGTVFKATRIVDGAAVAIKVLHGGAFAGARGKQRFAREAALLARLDHQNIPRILDRGHTTDGSTFIATAFVEGQAFNEFCLSRREDGDHEAIIRVLLKAARAIGSAHQLAIVHRDLKPQNVLVDSAAEPHVLDFGLGCSSDEFESTFTASGQIIGSLPWISPEQAEGRTEAVGQRSDVHALGLLLFYGLTGTHAFSLLPATSLTLRRIATEKAPSLRERRVHLPGRSVRTRDVERIISCCLSKAPRDRYADGNAFADDLENWINHRAVAGGARRTIISRRFLGLASLLFIVAAAGAATVFTRPFARDVAEKPDLSLPTIVETITGMKLLRVPPGKYTIGSSSYEEGYQPIEHPVEFTTSRGFWMGATEVTQREFKTVMGFLPSVERFDAELPVTNVSHSDCVEFCTRLSRASGQHFRLPTSPEWELACRAGDGTRLDARYSISDIAWYVRNSDHRLHPVGLKQPNLWGFFDMHGNAREICDVGIPAGESLAVTRGGSFKDDSSECRSGSREPADLDTRAVDLGFRVVGDVMRSK